MATREKCHNPDVSKNKITFDDVAGLKEEKHEMVEIVNFLKKPKKYTDMGARVPKEYYYVETLEQVKLLMLRAIAGEANVPFISMSGSEFIEMFAGLGASRVRKLFEKARKISPCIVFIDEIDAIGSRRSSSNGAESRKQPNIKPIIG